MTSKLKRITLFSTVIFLSLVLLIIQKQPSFRKSENDDDVLPSNLETALELSNQKTRYEFDPKRKETVKIHSGTVSVKSDEKEEVHANYDRTWGYQWYGWHYGVKHSDFSESSSCEDRTGYWHLGSGYFQPNDVVCSANYQHNGKTNGAYFHNWFLSNEDKSNFGVDIYYHVIFTSHWNAPNCNSAAIEQIQYEWSEYTHQSPSTDQIGYFTANITALKNDYTCVPFHFEGEFLEGSETAFNYLTTHYWFGGCYSEYYSFGISNRFDSLWDTWEKDERTNKRYQITVYHFYKGDDAENHDGTETNSLPQNKSDFHVNYEGSLSFYYIYAHQKITAGDKKIGSFITNIKKALFNDWSFESEFIKGNSDVYDKVNKYSFWWANFLKKQPTISFFRDLKNDKRADKIWSLEIWKNVDYDYYWIMNYSKVDYLNYDFSIDFRNDYSEILLFTKVTEDLKWEYEWFRYKGEVNNETLAKKLVTLFKKTMKEQPQNQLYLKYKFSALIWFGDAIELLSAPDKTEINEITTGVVAGYSVNLLGLIILLLLLPLVGYVGVQVYPIIRNIKKAQKNIKKALKTKKIKK